MATHDEDVPLSPDEIEWEQERAATLRTFEVVLLDGTTRRVFAHFWSDENPAGHLHFCSLQPSGRLLIHDAVNARLWGVVNEITPPAIAAHIDRVSARHHAQARGQKALEGMKRPDRRVH